MRAQEYKRAIELYSELRELPESEWAAALESACGGNAELSAEVMRLLHADRSASREQFLDRPVMEDAAQMLDGQFGCLPATGTLLGRYRIGARIGAGGMGVVYEARDERLDRRVGLKILPLSSSPGAEERIRRFEREARVISQLNHPNIISIFDADFDQGCYFIAMEFVEGQTLRSVIDGSTPGPDAKTVLEIVSQTASALAAAHEAGIVHRDIKPENIMLRPDGLVKILDFGLAAIRDPLGAPRGNFQTRPGQLAGTVRYLAPEQVAAKAATPRSDLFSLGVVAYELATRVRPFDGPSDGMIFNAILNVAPQPPSIMRSGIAPELDALVMGMIEKDPELRYQTANDVRSACRRLMRDSGSAVPPGRAPASRERLRTPRGVSRGAKALGFPLVSMAASVLLMAAVASLVWYAWPQPTPRVTRNVQVTNGEPVTAFVNDGTRLYYSVGKADSQARFLQVSTHGGQPKEIPEFRGMLPLDISADHSEILLGALGNGDLKSHALWTGPVLGGTPRRVGDLYASFAHWSSRGDQIVFTIGNDVRIAASDGSGARVLFHVNIGVPTAPFFFDADHRICFELGEENGDKVWQMNADGRDPHRVLPTWEGGLQNEAAVSPNGEYLVFMGAQNAFSWDLWTLREHAGFFRFHKPKPTRLTAGPVVAAAPQFSPDGRRIFYIGNTGVDELVRYDRQSNGWVPYLGGMDAFQLDFSRDGGWLTYVAPPGLSLWCSRVDGTEPRQLLAPPLSAVNPRWSPDGKSILFQGGVPGNPDGMFIVSPTGGTVVALTARASGAKGEREPSWSPDGRRVLYMTADDRMEVIDVATREIEKLPRSKGFLYPRWSPDGRYAAAPDVQSHLWLYDMATHERILLTTIGAGYPTWSRDSKYVYFENNACSIWYRANVRNHNVEEFVSLLGLRQPANSLGWVGVAPDGSVISARDVSTQNIYAIDWDYRQEQY